MPGFMPGTHVFLSCQGVDGRDKPGHDVESVVATHTIGIILNGATGRICSTQHVANALVPIRDEGGLPAGDDRIVPRLKLVGRNAEKLAAIARSYGAEWTTDLGQALTDPDFSVFFDAAATSQRHSGPRAAWSSTSTTSSTMRATRSA